MVSGVGVQFMPNGRGAVLQGVRTLCRVGAVGGLTDGQLLERFGAGRGGGEAAFEALVARHGPMVLGVCRQILGDRNDADDAFQATFLVLVRRAGAIRKRDSLGSWLYGVARRVALRAKAQAARRRLRERPGVESIPCAERVGDGDDRRASLHDEIQRLPEKY